MTINLDISEIYAYADQIVNVLLPVAYVSAGIALGFVVIQRIISVFRYDPEPAPVKPVTPSPPKPVTPAPPKPVTPAPINSTGIQKVLDKLSDMNLTLYKLRDRLEALERQNLPAPKAKYVQRATRRLDVPVEDLWLGVRVYNCVKNSRMHTVGDLFERYASGGDAAFLAIDNFGKKSLEELKAALALHGYDLSATQYVVFRRPRAARARMARYANRGY
jgi:hypothetical protein